MQDDWDLQVISIEAMAHGYALEKNPEDAGEAYAKAAYFFPQRLAKLLDEGWEVTLGDSTTAYLRRKKQSSAEAS